MHKFKFSTVVLLVAVLLCLLVLIFLVFRDGRRSEDAELPTETDVEEIPGSLDTTDTPGDTESSDDTLYIYCLDVGQGDATLIVSPSQQTMLVDAGKNGRGRDNVMPFLRNLNITSLDFVAATHYHEDHVGGIDEVIDSLSIDSIGVVYDHGGSYSSQTYDDYVTAAGAKRTTIPLDQVISLGGNVSLTCVAVDGNGIPSSPNENDLSVALKLTYGLFDFFVGGDLSGSNSGGYTDIETSVAPEVGLIEVYKVNHHGSNYSSNSSFIDTLQPKASIISVGKNSYGHPDSGVVAGLEALPSDICQTGDSLGNVVDGDITIKVCADEFWVNDVHYDCWGTFVGP